MNQPKPGTKAYYTLLHIGLYHRPLTFESDHAYGDKSHWGISDPVNECEQITSQMLYTILPFIHGTRHYEGGALVKITNARVEVQFVPAENEKI